MSFEDTIRTIMREEIREALSHESPVPTSHLGGELLEKIRANLYLSPTEAAVYLGVSVDWLYQVISKGEAPCFQRLGTNRRAKPSDLDAWIRERNARGVRLPKGKRRSVVRAVEGRAGSEAAEGDLGRDEEGGPAHGG
jgi:excisionase family DNA binding protein